MREGRSISATKEDALEAKGEAKLRFSTINCGLNPKRNENQVPRLKGHNLV